MHWKFQFNTSQKKLVFYEILFIGYFPVNGLISFYTDIKAVESVKKQAIFWRKMADFSGKYSENCTD